MTSTNETTGNYVGEFDKKVGKPDGTRPLKVNTPWA